VETIECRVFAGCGDGLQQTFVRVEGEGYAPERFELGGKSQ
jgi:hypothetical protein